MQVALENLVEINNELNKIQDLDIVLERILTLARSITNADAGSIYLYENNVLSIRYSQNDTLQSHVKKGERLIYNIFSVAVDRFSIAGYAAEQRKIINITDVYKLPPTAPYSFDDSYDQKTGYRSQSMAVFPLVSSSDDSLIGVLQLINAKDKENNFIAFPKETSTIIAFFVSMATLAIERTQSTRILLLHMVDMAGLRDPRETGMHVNRVASYAAELYERWAMAEGLDDNHIRKNKDRLRVAAMLHDVGKVAISDHILKKKGLLTEKEYEVMKTHTWKGAQLFRHENDPFYLMVKDVVLNHHQNWDGSGYPARINLVTGEVVGPALKGSEISIYAQVVALADVFDALTSCRSYKEAWHVDDAVNEIKKLSGRKFRPELVTLFLEMLPVIKRIGQRYSSERSIAPVSE
jgi:HD-GYP domain-containing protein (c-di-GMP phosphodiesterase class II)